MTQLIDKAAADYARETLAQPDYPTYNDEYEIMRAFEAGAEWAYSHVLKPADGDDLPEIDREVIVLTNSYMEVNLEEGYYVSFAHRPNPNGDAICFDKGGWNIPDVVWWLDCGELPKDK